MVSLPGDVAPERFEGFYGQTAPARALMKRQYGDIPPQNFLQRQGGLLAGIPHAISKLKNIDGFMHASTNYRAVQNAPSYLQMRASAVAKRNRDLEAIRSGQFKNDVKESALQQSLIAAEKKRRRENAPKVYRSNAAGLKLKQALRMVDFKGKKLMQRETTRSAVRKFGRSDRGELRELLRKIAGEEPDVEANDLAALAAEDLKKNPTRALDTSIRSDAATAQGRTPDNSPNNSSASRSV